MIDQYPQERQVMVIGDNRAMGVDLWNSRETVNGDRRRTEIRIVFARHRLVKETGVEDNHRSNCLRTSRRHHPADTAGQKT